MRPDWGRLIRHSAVAGIFLGVLGYALAHGFLMMYRIQSEGAYNAQNERVLWQTPLVMAGFGILLTGGLGLLLGSFRKPAIAHAPPQSK